MSLVEKEITTQNIERARNHSEFEKRRETEQKLIPSNPEVFVELFKAKATPIEQIYLSSPDDEFSLRLRCSYLPDGSIYKATQKDRGAIVDSALERTEIDTEISHDAYEHFAAMDLPRIHKFRFDIADGVSVDFYDSEQTPVIVEVENKDAAERAQLIAMIEAATNSRLIDKSDSPALTNEHIAHQCSPEHSPRTPESLDAFSARIAREMVAHYVAGKQQVVVGLTGMSGSGKTTVTRAIEAHIVEAFGESYRPIILSTDDYHFGKTKLEQQYGAPYSDWDSPLTYNTAELAADLEQLAEGTPLLRRHFNFETEEPSYDNVVNPSPFVVIEGLYAGSKDLAAVRDLHFELPTSIATSIGRDVRRLIIENRANRAFPTPESRLQYQIETALPLYLSQERPSRNSFSASMRPLAERAFMLGQITRSTEYQTQELQG